ncbi:hypothetical protein BYT27DRAFT_7204063 [Phlegmacium glaucopus]|nr:hypothetical protein BYT27DRAFT_7204063 [Phlegmacium glaucopus]
MPVTSISEIPTDAPGPIIITGQIYAAPGNADRLQELLSKIQKHARSDAEPDCLEYKTARSFVTEGVIKFTVWEAYKNLAALKTHFESKTFVEVVTGLQADGLLDRTPTAEYFYEF